MEKHKPKIIVILGPTSSGKSEVAIRLAKKLGGEIISADSRQVYRGMDIGTGKVTGRLQTVIPSKRSASRDLVFISGGIPHYLIDIVSPQADYNVSKFKKDAEKIIADILSRGKMPIICGGTGFWIKAVVDNVLFPAVKPDWKLREKLAGKSITELIQELKKLDPVRTKNIDVNNKVRLIRAIEICKAIGKVPEISSRSTVHSSQYEFLQIGIDVPKEKLQANIRKRLKKRFRQGMIEEMEKLHTPPAGGSLSWKKIQNFGLGYYWIPLYLQGKLPKEKLFERIFLAEKNYAKRQMTWFRKDPIPSRQDGSYGASKRIMWLKNYRDIEKEVKKFLKK